MFDIKQTIMLNEWHKLRRSSTVQPMKITFASMVYHLFAYVNGLVE